MGQVYMWSPTAQKVLTGFHFSLHDIILAPFQTWEPRLSSYVLPIFVDFLTWPVSLLFLGAALAGLYSLLPFASANPTSRTAALKATSITLVALCGLIPPIFYASVTSSRYFATGLIPLFLIGGWFLCNLAQWLQTKLQKYFSNFRLGLFRMSRPSVNRPSLKHQSESPDFKQSLTSPILSLALTLGVSSLALALNFSILTDLIHAPLPENTRSEYVSGPAAAYGYAELAQTLRREALATPYTVKLILISPSHANIQVSWAYPLLNYMRIFPDKQSTFLPANIEAFESSDIDLYHQAVLTTVKTTSGSTVLVAIEGTPDQHAAWLNLNPNFELEMQYVGPNSVTSFALYKYKLP
jgi:hypothetical protein